MTSPESVQTLREEWRHINRTVEAFFEAMGKAEELLGHFFHPQGGALTPWACADLSVINPAMPPPLEEGTAEACLLYEFSQLEAARAVLWSVDASVKETLSYVADATSKLSQLDSYLPKMTLLDDAAKMIRSFQLGAQAFSMDITQRGEETRRQMRDRTWVKEAEDYVRDVEGKHTRTIDNLREQLSGVIEQKKRERNDLVTSLETISRLDPSRSRRRKECQQLEHDLVETEHHLRLVDEDLNDFRLDAETVRGNFEERTMVYKFTSVRKRVKN